MDAQAITQKSKSNLAFAFLLLPKSRRRNLEVFYAFCRLVDDLADADDLAQEERRSGLNIWRSSLHAPTPGEHALAQEVRQLIQAYTLPRGHFEAIIEGCEWDLAPREYRTWEDLCAYCDRVATAVGLISLRLFECRSEATVYATQLGRALQLTNILRDVGEDYARDSRLYLPREDMERFGVTESTIAHAERSEAFLKLMDFETERAESLFRAAAAAFPKADRRQLAASDLMRRIYQRLLQKMQAGRFKVFGHRYRLTGWEKAIQVAGAFWHSR